MSKGHVRTGGLTFRALAALIGAGLILTSCETIRPVVPPTKADCDELIRTYAKTRKDAVNLKEWTDRDWDRDLKTWDTKGDGHIDRSEWNASALKLIADNPGDPALKRILRESNKLFDRIDLGHKGYLNRHDFEKDSVATFNRQDRNHDGWVTRAECMAEGSTPPPVK
jgi:hypothetical protein